MAVFAASACASPSASPSPEIGGPAASSSASPGFTDPGLPLETPPDMTGKPGKPVEVTVTGQVTAGVEPGCRLISDGRTSYLLLGGDENVAKIGAQVTVTGTVGEGMMTTCQQGTPLQVTSVKAS
ncbi:hypothetical protein [Catenuloplanes japonicus]|uniref:hypothetical protein n=1 Tax=Catenuloplanes japonicus TaxID=33876 RepID=UPI000A61ED86|nr:hypothetical protein [Catenuloplanes japonicus]